MDKDIQGNHHHVADTRAGDFFWHSKCQDAVQTTHGRKWESTVATLMGSQEQSHPNDREIRCPCGQLIARWTLHGVEIKCKRCRRVVCIPFKSIRGYPPAHSD